MIPSRIVCENCHAQLQDLNALLRHVCNRPSIEEIMAINHEETNINKQTQS